MGRCLSQTKRSIFNFGRKNISGTFFGGGRSHLARITIGGISFVPCFRLLSSAGILNSLVSEDLFQFG